VCVEGENNLSGPTFERDGTRFEAVRTMSSTANLVEVASRDHLREAESGSVVTPLRLDDSMQHACASFDGDDEGRCCSLKKWRTSCCSNDPVNVTPRTLWIATGWTLASFAAFCAALVVLIVMLTDQQQQHDAQLAAAANGSSPIAGSSINYTAAQARWVELRDSLNLTLLSAESSQAKALRYLSLMPELHDAAQQFAVAVVYYDWGGPYWNLQVRDEYRKGGRWMPDPTSLPGTAGNDGDISSQPNAAAAVECSWRGIACDSKGRVSEMNLTDASAFSFAQGTIPTELGMLTRMTALSVPEHGLQGSIPAELASLAGLRELDLRSNKIESANPWLLQLTTKAAASLERLRLGYNFLQDEWKTPELDVLRRCTNLVELDVKNNPELTSDASLLESAEAWPNLTDLSVGQTGLSIVMNDLVGSWGNLQHLDAGGSTLSGTLSPYISPTIRSLILVASGGGSGIGGSLPTEIGLWTRLEEIDLDYNPLETTIPTEIGQATSLKTFSAKYIAGLTGTIPTEFGQLINLERLDLSTTSLSGTFPAEVANCRKLTVLKIDATSLVGSLPEELCGTDRNWYELSAGCLVHSTDPVFQCPCCTNCFNT
jgi:Leucine-rich repeat (LRR) protein